MIIQAYGVLLLAAIVAAVLVAVFARKRLDVEAADVAVIAPAGVIVAFIAAHWFDVMAYQGSRPGAWLQFFSGHALFGALLGVAIVTVSVGLSRKRPLLPLADLVALATITAMVIGRVGCSIVHDHPGVPTTITFLSHDFDARWAALDGAGFGVEPIRLVTLFDVGRLELIVSALISFGSFSIFARNARRGMIAAFTAIAYGVGRFGLDFLRSPSTEPEHLGLTAGQWGGLALVALGIWIAIASARSYGRPQT